MNPTAKLLYHSPISSIITAMNTCVRKVYPRLFWGDGLSPEEQELIESRILKRNRDLSLCTLEEITEPKHETVLEHLVYTFDLQFSRAVLHEFRTQRVGTSYSVESTRFTLKKNKNPLYYNTGNIEVDGLTEHRIKEMKDIKAKNDIKKYALPDPAITKCQWTVNSRALRHFFNLRSRRSALKEIRMLSEAIYNELPIDHVFLYEDCYWIKDGELK